MTRTNLHATALVVGATGLLIVGRSGAGKSMLALHMLGTLHARGIFAALVADDQIWLDIRGDRLVAEAPQTIAGMIEVRGYGPASIAFEKKAVIDRVVALVDPAEAPRYREDAIETILGIPLPRLDLPHGDAPASARAVFAWLGLSPAGGRC